MFKKNISDGVGSRKGSNGTPLNPPLFWLDNIFNLQSLDNEIVSNVFRQNVITQQNFTPPLLDTKLNTVLRNSFEKTSLHKFVISYGHSH